MHLFIVQYFYFVMFKNNIIYIFYSFVLVNTLYCILNNCLLGCQKWICFMPT